MTRGNGGCREDQELRMRAAAVQAAERSYSPYSRFRVGAAVLCEDGSIFPGTNVENRSYGLTICAERSAVVSAVAAGRRELRAVYVVGLDSPEALPPCGACRQVLSEFLPPDAPVYCAGAAGEALRLTMGELMPHDSLHDLRSGL